MFAAISIFFKANTANWKVELILEFIHCACFIKIPVFNYEVKCDHAVCLMGSFIGEVYRGTEVVAFHCTLEFSCCLVVTCLQFETLTLKLCFSALCDPSPWCSKLCNAAPLLGAVAVLWSCASSTSVSSWRCSGRFGAVAGRRTNHEW